MENKIILLDNNEMLKFCLFMCDKYQEQTEENPDEENGTNNGVDNK